MMDNLIFETDGMTRTYTETCAIIMEDIYIRQGLRKLEKKNGEKR